MRTLLAVLLLSACLARPAAATTTLQPADIFRLGFTTLAFPNCTVGPCDPLIFNLGFTNNSNGARITTARLYNSSTLLGTFQATSTCITLGTCAVLVPSFVAPASVYGLASPVIDFTSILNGTIVGVLDITFDKPIDFDTNSPFNFLMVTHATGQGSGTGGYFRDYDSLSVVPESASITLLGLGLASMVFPLRRNKAANGTGL